MSVNERRQHFRIEDHVYFNFRPIEPGQVYSDKAITNYLLGNRGHDYLETTNYFQSVDYELSELSKVLIDKDPKLMYYLSLLNAKIDYLARQLTLGGELQLRKVNLSLGGMSFKTKERIKEKTMLKIMLYTKPKMLPILLNASVIYSQFHDERQYRTAVQFEGLSEEQEQLLSQHIMLAQAKCQAD